MSFARGSRPHMLRVSPDGKYVWVQNARTDTNEILDSQSLQVLNAQPVGKVPTTNAWTPDGRQSWILHEGDNHLIVMEAQPPFRQLRRVEVGPGPGNVSFRPDGKYAYVTVGGLNAVAVIDNIDDDGWGTPQASNIITAFDRHRIRVGGCGGRARVRVCVLLAPGAVPPERLADRYGVLVPKVDTDDNEVVGIRLPDITTPIGRRKR